MSRPAANLDDVPPGEYVPTADERVVMHGVSWEAFESIVAVRRGRARPRFAYLAGALEIMSPSRTHEIMRKRFAAVIEAYLHARRIPFEGAGSWLIKQAPEEAGLQPDECYIFGDFSKDRPDLAIEVVWTSGGVDKLEIYRRLGIPEVWMWIKGAIRVFVIDGGGFVERNQSACVPSFDFAVVLELMDLPSLGDVLDELARRFPRVP
ncbi:MAG: Uma2 family endonuclease [Kofleriaceae bacterium]|nr:Uma2 family endonuclease [Kofleriaceae bacterium]